MTVQFHIGIDDTDSPTGGCTTYTMTIIVDELRTAGFQLEGYPCLVRLNPNVPWKTRGNAALALHLRAERERLDEIRRVASSILRETSTISEEKTDPAIVFLEGPVPDVLREFYSRALTDIVQVDSALQIAGMIGAETFFLKGQQGIVGALASIGADLDTCDHTYEMIAYRERENCGTPRRVDPSSVKRMDEKMNGRTYNNLDPETGRVLIAPHGPDPVLFGVRGEDPESVTGAFGMVEANEPIERTALFISNQGTDAHLLRGRHVKELQAYQSGNITGEIVTAPQSSRGGHVFFQIADNNGKLDCAGFEPTGPFRHAILQLTKGDKVRVYGGVRPGRKDAKWIINLEKLEVLDLAEVTEKKLMTCTTCGGTFESMGKGQGQRCRKCGLKTSSSPFEIVRRERSLKRGFYLPPPRAHRHLTRPVSRTIRSEKAPSVANPPLKEASASAAT